MHHGPGERFRVLLAGKVQSVHELGVPPLVKGSRRLVVLEALDDRAVDDDLVVLQFPADHSECVVLLVVEDLHFTETGRTARWYPFFLAIVVHHHRGAGSDYTLLAHISGRGYASDVQRFSRRCNFDAAAGSAGLGETGAYQIVFAAAAAVFLLPLLFYFLLAPVLRLRCFFYFFCFLRGSWNLMF